jgi:hypothetical protein
MPDINEIIKDTLKIKPRERGPKTVRFAPRRFDTEEQRKERRERNLDRRLTREDTRARRRHGRPRGR